MYKNETFAADYENGKLYLLKEDAYDDDGDPQECIRTLPVIRDENQRFVCNSVEFSVIVGEAPLTGQGSDPILRLRWSDNKGKTWSNWRSQKIGKRGEYNTRVIYRLLGQFRQRVFQVSFSEPIPFAIENLTVMEIKNGKN